MRIPYKAGTDMQDHAKRKKKAVNLSIDAELLGEAKAAGTNLSGVLEGALREQLRSAAGKWRGEPRHNRKAMPTA
jgi:antitoxin CcdA